MVIKLAAIFAVAIACQILFFIYGKKNKAKSDVYFYSLSIISLAIVIALAGNVFFLRWGDDYFFVSKIFLSLHLVLFTILALTLTSISIAKFNRGQKNLVIVKFIFFLIGISICAICFVNLWNEQVFKYSIKEFENLKSIFGPFAKLLVLEPSEVWRLFNVLWTSIIYIYLLINIVRIIIRGIENSVKEFLILIFFSIEVIFFLKFIEQPQHFILETVVFALLIPAIYYKITYFSKPIFVKRILRSRVFENAKELMVVFNADNLLTDYNSNAQKIFNFTSNDIYKLTIGEFVKNYIPLGTVPPESVSIDQIYVKTNSDQKLVFHLDFFRPRNFAHSTICSYFILHDITNLFENFAEIQQASMTDHITGLFAQHVLMKKMREINIFRKFPYTVASCGIHIVNQKNVVNENFALVKVAECIKSKIRGADFAAFENGHIILLFSADVKIAQNVMDRIVSAIKDDEYLKDDVDFQYGLANKENPDEDIQQTLNRAHEIMFKNKIESENN